MAELQAADLFSVKGMKFLITGAGSGKSPQLFPERQLTDIRKALVK